MDQNPYQSPQAPLSPFMFPAISTELYGEFLAPRTAVVAMLYAGAAVSGVQTLLLAYQWHLLGRMGGAGNWTQEEAELNDLVVTSSAGLFAVVYLITLIVWWRWQLRAAHNIRAFGRRTFAFSPGWSIGYYFVPILNLFKPFQAMKEIEKASTPGVEVDCPNFEQMDGSALVGWWWALWIIGNIAGRIVTRLPAETIPELQASSLIGVAQCVWHLILCLVAARMIRGINANQLAKAGRLDQAADQQV